MSGNQDQEYDNQNDDSQDYDDSQDQDQEYDSQEENSQNNGNNDGDEGDDGDDCDDGDEEGNDCNDEDDNDCNDDEDDEDENSDGPKYIRLRGLPWSATHREILDFLKGINVVGGAEGIHIVTRRWDGVNTGEAYVELKGKQDAAAAMKLDNATMGHRYIEVFNASPREAKDAMRKTSSHGNSYVVKLRGLPYSVTEQQIEDFFNGLEIKPDREGIVFVTDRRGRATGEAFVQFESQEDTEQALGRNRQKIGHRYIEIFRSSLAELKRSTNGSGRMAPYDLKDRGGNIRGGNGSDYGGNSRNNRWGGNGTFGVGANNTLGFNNLPSFGNNSNFGNSNGNNFGNFGNNGGGVAGGGVGGNFGNFGNNNNGGGNFGNFGGNNAGGSLGNNSRGGNMGSGGGFNRFSGNSGNFGNDFGDFGNFGNNRSNNNMVGGNNMSSGGGGGGSGVGGGFNNFSNFGNGGGSNLGGGGSFGNNMIGGPGNGGGNFGPIGGGRSDDLCLIMMRGLPFTSFEEDVYKFFEPLRPVNVRIHYNKQNGRHNGTAEALFENHDDAQLAMKRHRCKMGKRYIELFFNGKAKSGKGGGNNYSSGGNMSSGNSIGNGNNSIGVGGGGMGGNVFSRRI